MEFRNNLQAIPDKLSQGIDGRLSFAEIIKTIQASYPDHAILAEESGISGNSSDYTWIIDPIDGTTNFFHGHPHFFIVAQSIA